MSYIQNECGSAEWLANQQRIAANTITNQVYPLPCNCIEVSNNGYGIGYTSDGSGYTPYFTISNQAELLVYNNTVLKTIMFLDFDNQSIYVVVGGSMSSAANPGALVQFFINK